MSAARQENTSNKNSGFPLEQICKSIQRAMKSEFYKKHFAHININDIKSADDFYKLPFTDKEDLRDAYPLGLQAVPDDKIVRIHS